MKWSQDLEGLKELYANKKAEAIAERAELERLRSLFAAQGDKASILEAVVGQLKEAIVDKLMEREGLIP